MNLTAVIITLNEERRLARCINSLPTSVSEVVVVDSGSSDQTVAIASSSKARVIHQSWLGYARQRDVGISAASNEWIFVIDADEVVCASLKSTVDQLFSTEIDPRQVFSVDRPKDFLGVLMPSPARRANIEREVRLFNRKFAQYETSDVHERVAYRGKPKVLIGPLLHLQGLTFSGEIEKAQFYSGLEATALYESGQRPTLRGLLLRPILRFVFVMLVKGWISFGWQGLAQAALRAFWEFTREVKLRELYIERKS